MSAFLMAALLNGMNASETLALTEAMLHSGEVLNLSSIEGCKVDKHSTGGVGDKVSICLAPLVASAGVYVPMIAGRGLGHTGGTLDKLESIRGYKTSQSAKAFERIVREVGASIIGQTEELAPADRRIYALRDVTGTVESIPLIVASILSKKLAEGIDGLVLDVKVGSGAFMKTRADARRLAKALVRVGQRAGKRMVGLLTDMTRPLGNTVGNALEVREAIQIVKNGGPSATREITLALGVEMLLLAKVATEPAAARKILERKLVDGSAAERLERMIAAHGGDARVVERPALLPEAPEKAQVIADRSGTVLSIDPLALGLLAIDLGAGRTRADQPVDPAVGIELSREVGDRVERGDVLATIHARSPSAARSAVAKVRAALRIARGKAKKTALVCERIEH
jgi:pyrimidine-nucleoside phosphorylase